MPVKGQQQGCHVGCHGIRDSITGQIEGIVDKGNFEQGGIHSLRDIKKR